MNVLTDIIRTRGIKKKIMQDIAEKNGFHEVTNVICESMTQPEWQEILSRHYRGLDIAHKNIHVDLDSETIRLEDQPNRFF